MSKIWQSAGSCEISGALRSHSHYEMAREVIPRYSASCSCVISFSRRRRLRVEPIDTYLSSKKYSKALFCFNYIKFQK